MRSRSYCVFSIFASAASLLLLSSSISYWTAALASAASCSRSSLSFVDVDLLDPGVVMPTLFRNWLLLFWGSTLEMTSTLDTAVSPSGTGCALKACISDWNNHGQRVRHKLISLNDLIWHNMFVKKRKPMLKRQTDFPRDLIEIGWMKETNALTSASLAGSVRPRSELVWQVSKASTASISSLSSKLGSSLILLCFCYVDKQ